MPPSKNSSSPRSKRTPSSPSPVSDGVFVGGRTDAPNFEGDRVCVLDEAPDDLPPATHIPVYDGEHDAANVSNLERVVETVRRARAQGRPVLIFCGHGVRRSPLAAAWYLHRTEGLPLSEAYERIRAVRPQIETASEWLGDTSNLEGA
jgi:hypothetical protein